MQSLDFGSRIVVFPPFVLGAQSDMIRAPRPKPMTAITASARSEAAASAVRMLAPRGSSRPLSKCSSKYRCLQEGRNLCMRSCGLCWRVFLRRVCVALALQCLLGSLLGRLLVYLLARWSRQSAGQPARAPAESFSQLIAFRASSL